MKKMMIGVVALGLLMTTATYAQQDTTLGQKVKTGAKKTGKAIGKGATAVGNKTAELASKGSSHVVDQVYEDKVAPNGSTVYMNNHSKYYWIDKKGKRHYVNESALKNKPRKD